MRKHYHPDEDYSKRYNNEYRDMCNFLYKNADIVIKYEDLVEFPEKVLSRICSDLNFDIDPLDIPVPITEDNKENTYLRSSKISQKYNEKHFDINDIEDCYGPYTKLLSKRIDL
jgi:hypothetical protein